VATQLEITRRLLGSSAIVTQDPGASDIRVTLDVESLVRRLLLFDTYILYSVRLKEIPDLVRRFGYEGALALLGSGALESGVSVLNLSKDSFRRRLTLL